MKAVSSDAAALTAGEGHGLLAAAAFEGDGLLDLEGEDVLDAAFGDGRFGGWRCGGIGR